MHRFSISRSAAAAEGRAWPSLLEASASGGRAPLPARLLDRRAAPEHGAAAEAAERLLRSQPKPKVCSKCASPVRPAPCHACCMKQTPRDSSSRIVVSPLFVSSPRPKRPSPPGVYVSTICPRFPLLSLIYGRRSSHVRALLGAAPSAGTPPPFPSTDFPLTSPSNTFRLLRGSDHFLSPQLFSRYEYVRSAAPGIGDVGGGGGDGGGDDDDG